MDDSCRQWICIIGYGKVRRSHGQAANQGGVSVLQLTNQFYMGYFGLRLSTARRFAVYPSIMSFLVTLSLVLGPLNLDYQLVVTYSIWGNF